MYALNQLIKTPVCNDLAASACHSHLNSYYGVLSLTRNPLNALMWAHYGDQHAGVVIGINMEVAGFNKIETNLIPATYGDLIYTSSKPRNQQLDVDDERLLQIGKNCKRPINHTFK